MYAWICWAEVVIDPSPRPRTKIRLRERGVTLVSAKEKFGDGYMGGAMEAIRDIMNEVQVRQSGEDIKIKMARKVQRSTSITRAIHKFSGRSSSTRLTSSRSGNCAGCSRSKDSPLARPRSAPPARSHQARLPRSCATRTTRARFATRMPSTSAATKPSWRRQPS